MILRPLLRLLLATSLGRAFARRLPKWLSVALAIVLVRFFDRRGVGERPTAGPNT